jgi:inosine-uridine nucleoside N-ribohydrolase
MLRTSNTAAQALSAIALSLSISAASAAPARFPVVLDTDIGDDIDDTWALAMLLRSPQLDLRLVTTTYGKAEYRARVIAKLLTVAGRTDVPIGLGAGGREGTGKQQAWVEDYALASYAGTVHEDGVQSLIDAINASPVPLTIISIGPSDTVAAALGRQPDIAGRAIFVGMQGSVRRGYEGGAVCPEWNLRANIPAAKAALMAPWKQMVITPLDTCGLVRLQGARFAALKRCSDPVIQALLENYRVWAGKNSIDELTESSVLFDTVAVYLAWPGAKPLLTMEDLRIVVRDDGTTALDALGMPMSVAAAWQDLEAYYDLLVQTLSGEHPGPVR